MSDSFQNRLHSLADEVEDVEDDDEVRAAFREITRDAPGDVDGQFHVLMTTCRLCLRHGLEEEIPGLIRVYADCDEAVWQDARDDVMERIREVRDETNLLDEYAEAYDEAVESILQDLRE